MNETNLPSRHVVLIGAGHTHLHVIRMWAERSIFDTRLTLVSTTPCATYSGMFPGVLAGLYEPDEMLIDLHQLTYNSGIHLIVDECTRIDSVSRRIHFGSDRPSIGFDVASIGIGSRPSRVDVAADHPGFVPVKPMFKAVRRLQQQVEKCVHHRRERNDSRGLQVAVVGGGAAGVEIAFCIQPFLHRILAESNCGTNPAQVTLIDSASRIMRGYREQTAHRAAGLLQARGIQLACQRRVVASRENALVFDDGSEHTFDIVVWCTSASPLPLNENTDLARAENGFILVDETLRSVDEKPIFAVGDCAEIRGNPVPRAGVYAVREGAVLWQNLQNLLHKEPLVRYRPQTDFLSLLAVGDGTAIGQYRCVTSHGAWLWKLKNRIDTRFMNMHRPMKNAPANSRSNTDMRRNSRLVFTADRGVQDFQMAPMRCRGCGGKTSADVLSEVLRQLREEYGDGDRDFLQPEDAAALSDSRSTVHALTVDMITAVVRDEWLAGRIAAVHAMSDLWARSVIPTVAMATVCLPPGPHHAQAATLHAVLSGAVREFRAANVVLAGGHTMDAGELAIGFTILGRTADGASPPQLSGKSGLTPGQNLILTKPLGSGVILAGREMHPHRRGDAANRSRRLEKYLVRSSAAAVENAITTMLQSNAEAARIARNYGATSVTDITGFGLAGHLIEMIDASNVSARLKLDAIPLIDGAAELFDAGICSTLDPKNRSVAGRMQVPDHPCDPLSVEIVFGPQRNERSHAVLVTECPQWHAMFDPQTSGGLLIAVDMDCTKPLINMLRSAGYLQAAVIGVVDSSTQ
ncbi:MAG: selenide, water dikinase SelD [Planctomycetaceae bacterium]